LEAVRSTEGAAFCPGKYFVSQWGGLSEHYTSLVRWNKLSRLSAFITARNGYAGTTLKILTAYRTSIRAGYAVSRLREK